jgi:hypothetical protein
MSAELQGLVSRGLPIEVAEVHLVIVSSSSKIGDRNNGVETHVVLPVHEEAQPVWFALRHVTSSFLYL